jgi:serine/threonine protein kinase
MSELTGRILLDRYQVREFLGRGGMAEVYKVWDAHRSTDLAMKILHEDLAFDRVFMRRFQREADTLAQLQHPNIVRFYGLEQDGPLAFMLLDFVDGDNLKRLIFDTGGSLPSNQILIIMRSVCSALQFAHGEGMVHCDIKPGNIMIHRNGTVLVADFGIARMTDAATTTMVGMGTPAYMAPEQVGGLDPTPQTDIYALGIVLFEMLTGGERPFTGEHAQTTGSTSEKVRWEHLHLQAPSPRFYNPGISPDLEAVVLKCLAKEPSERYTSATALFEALESALSLDDETLVETIIAVPSTAALPAAPTIAEEVSPVPAPFPPEQIQVPSEQAPARKRSSWVILALLISAVVVFFGFYIFIRSSEPANGDKATQQSLGAQAARVALTETAIAFISLPSITFEPTTTLPPITPTSEATNTPIPPTPTLAVASLSGDGIVQLTFDSGNYYKPSLSSDQRRMVAFAQIGRNWQIVAVDPDNGGVLRQVTSENADYHHPLFSRDGESLLVASDRSGYFNIYLLNYENGEIVRQLTDSRGTDMTPYWFPEEQRFVFMSNRDGDYEVFIGHLDGSPPQQLTDNDAYDGSTTVSPDGKFIAFYSNRSGNPDIFIMDVDSGEITQLTTSTARDAEPDFSPNGDWVAFESNRDGNYDIWAVRTDGSGLRRVTSNPDNEQVPVFSPDGKWIFYQSNPSGGYDIYRIPWP